MLNHVWRFLQTVQHTVVRMIVQMHVVRWLQASRCRHERYYPFTRLTRPGFPYTQYKANETLAGPVYVVKLTVAGPAGPYETL